MKPIVSIPVLLIVAFSSVARATGGEGTRGGGNAIRCDDGHLYSWDYINFQSDQMPAWVNYLRAKSADEILASISERLAAYNPVMNSHLDDFRKFNHEVLSKSSIRVWLKGVNPLVPIGDELRIRIPKSCVANAGPAFQLLQAVIRTATGSEEDPGQIRYAYDPEILKGLEKTHPLQLSTLYIHEWLRDYTDNVQTIAILNQLLHSAAWPDALAFHGLLQSLGVRFTYVGIPNGRYVPKSQRAATPFKEIKISRSEKGQLQFHWQAASAFKSKSQGRIEVTSATGDDSRLFGGRAKIGAFLVLINGEWQNQEETEICVRVQVKGANAQPRTYFDLYCLSN